MKNENTMDIITGLLLAACAPDIPPTEQPTEEPPIETQAPPTEPPATQELIETEEPDPTEPPATESPVPTETLALSEVEGPEPLCAKILTPEDVFEAPAVGKATFAWEPVEGVDSYILRFTLPTGNIVEFETDETTKDRYMEAFDVSGEFEWKEIALNADGNEIYTSEAFNFTKLAAQKKPKSGDSSDGGNSGDSGSDDGAPPVFPPTQPDL